MKTACAKVGWTIGLVGFSVAALAGETKAVAPPQEPVGFITGGVIGAFAAGPVGAVIGAGLGTWLGNRVHRAGQASAAEAKVALLESDKEKLATANTSLAGEKGELADTNRVLTARLEELSQNVEAARAAQNETDAEQAAKVLDGLKGDVLFRTGSAQIAPDMSQAIRALAEAVAKSPALKVKLDGYADPRGSAQTNLELSQARADAVRDVFLAAGVDDAALEVSAYGKSQSVAADSDGYALERRVRLTLQAAGEPEAARIAKPADDATAPAVSKNQ